MSQLPVITIVGNKTAMKICKVPLSNDSFHRCILKMFSDIEKDVGGNKLKYSDFALQVDELTNITKKA